MASAKLDELLTGYLLSVQNGSCTICIYIYMCKIIRQRWAVPDCNAGWVFQTCNTSLAMQDIISVQNGLCKIATQNGLHKKLCKYGGLCKIEMQDGLCNIAIHNGLCKTFVSCIGAKVGCVKNMGSATLQDESCRITMSS